MKVRNLDGVVKELGALLPDYLEKHDLDPTKLFSCPNPEHEDSSPSCGVVPSTDNRIAHCFGCEESFNIFKVAHFLEKKPLTGQAWVEENVCYLAKLFNIKLDISDDPMTPEEIERQKRQDATEKDLE